MYRMQFKKELFEFDWDSGNLDKSYERHGVTPKEIEEVFISEKSYIVPDVKHSQSEKRFIILGKNQEGKDLFVVFTLRGQKVRVVSARKMHKKEVLKYEKAKKDSTI